MISRETYKIMVRLEIITGKFYLLFEEQWLEDDQTISSFRN